MSDTRLSYLFDLYTRREASEQEENEFLELLGEPSNKRIIQELIDSLIIRKDSDTMIVPDNASDILQAIFHAGKSVQPLSKTPNVDIQSAATPARSIQPPVHRIHFLKTAWFRYAAAIVIIAGAGLYFWNNSNTRSFISQIQETIPLPVQTDVNPGGDRAILTLSDGSTIVLDNASNGTLIEQGGSKVNKLSNGEIQYINTQKGAGSPVVLFNTMSTPRGGQYQIVLPDGSRVWLNAASSITYPTAFVGMERRVTITGEVYFEVAKNEKMPFHVEAENVEIKVLGTHFNVNAYRDEDVYRTTLLEGSIQLKKGGQQTSVKPGEQAQWTATHFDPVTVSDEVNIDQVMAWQKGLFEFNNTSLEAILRQVSRWYDVDVIFEKRYPLKKFGGGISRKLPLSNLLKMLEANGVKFRLDGKLLKVL